MGSVNRKNIIFFGHSLIEFHDWQKRFPRHHVVNLGIAGETAEGLLARTGEMVNIYPSADLVFIMTGTNNIAMEDYDFLDSYRDIIRILSSAYPGARIYIHSVLPVIFEWISNESIKKVNQMIRALAEETEANYVDLYPAFVDDQGEPIAEYLLDDGVHLSGSGYEVWCRMLDEIINDDL